MKLDCTKILSTVTIHLPHTMSSLMFGFEQCKHAPCMSGQWVHWEIKYSSKVVSDQKSLQIWYLLWSLLTVSQTCFEKASSIKNIYTYINIYTGNFYSTLPIKFFTGQGMYISDTNNNIIIHTHTHTHTHTHHHHHHLRITCHQNTHTKRLNVYVPLSLSLSMWCN